jgi:hypothetical protein
MCLQKSNKQNNLQRIRNTGTSSNKIKINKPDPTFQKCFCSCQGMVPVHFRNYFISFYRQKMRYEVRKKGERTVLKNLPLVDGKDKSGSGST